MANFPISKPLDPSSISIIEGKYIVPNNKISLETRPALITNNKVFTKNAFELLGCVFPKLEKQEPESTETLTRLSTKINNMTSPVFITEEAITNVIQRSYTHTIKYKLVLGVMYLNSAETQVIDPDVSLYFPLINDDRSFYYFYNDKLYIAKQSPKSKNSFYLDTEITDLTQEQKDDLQFDNGSISATQTNISAMAQSESPVANRSLSGTDILATRQYTIKYNLYIGIIRNIATYSMYAGDALHADLLNKILLEDGVADYSNNSSLIQASNNTFKTDAKKFFDIDAPDLRNNAINIEKGIWSNKAWRTQKIANNTYPTKTSYSSLHTYMVCPYKYMYEYKTSRPVVLRDDKTVSMEVGSSGGADVLGTIIHLHGENLVSERIRNGGAPLSPDRVSVYEKAAISNWLGQNLDDYDLGITTADISRIPNDRRQEGLGIISNSMATLNARTYAQDYDTFLAESVVETSYDVVETIGSTQVIKKRFNMIGYIDGIYYKQPSSPGGQDWKLAFSDIKSGRIFKTDDKLAQLVWYLYFAHKQGYLGEGPNKITLPFTSYANVRDLLLSDKVALFYDFCQYNDSEGIINIDISKRETLLNLIITTFESAADDIIKYENDFNHIKLVKRKKSPESCKYCEYKAVCPEYTSAEVNAFEYNRLLKNRNLGVNIIQKSNQDIDDENLEQYLSLYQRIAAGEDVIKVIAKREQEMMETYNARQTDLREINASYPTQIGAVYLASPIIRIGFSDEKRYGMNNTLRATYPAIHRVEGTEQIVNLIIRFAGIESINSEMRHIVAQYQAFPFVSIRNRELTRIMLPFDNNKDQYWAMSDPETFRYVKQYLTVKSDNDVVDEYNTDENSPSQIKNKIYERTRLFYSISGFRISPVPNQVDTIDVTMRLQLIDTSIITSKGNIEYLIDTHATLLQHAWIYNNSTIEKIAKPNSIPERIIQLVTPPLPEVWNEITSIRISKSIKEIEISNNQLHLPFLNKKGKPHIPITKETLVGESLNLFLQYAIPYDTFNEMTIEPLILEQKHRYITTVGPTTVLMQTYDKPSQYVYENDVYDVTNEYELTTYLHHNNKFVPISIITNPQTTLSRTIAYRSLLDPIVCNFIKEQPSSKITTTDHTDYDIPTFVQQKLLLVKHKTTKGDTYEYITSCANHPGLRNFRGFFNPWGKLSTSDIFTIPSSNIPTPPTPDYVFRNVNQSYFNNNRINKHIAGTTYLEIKSLCDNITQNTLLTIGGIKYTNICVTHITIIRLMEPKKIEKTPIIMLTFSNKDGNYISMPYLFESRPRSISIPNDNFHIAAVLKAVPLPNDILSFTDIMKNLYDLTILFQDKASTLITNYYNSITSYGVFGQDQVLTL